jgi:hypothetical protein
MPTGTWDTQSGASRSTAPAARDRRLRSAERVGGGGKRRPDVQLGYRREASHGRRHGELEAQAAGGGGGPHALELGLARGARRVWVRQRAHDEPLGSGAVEAGRGCRAAAAGPSRAGTGGEAPAGLRSSRAGSPDAGRVRRRRAPGSTCRAGLGAAAAGPGSARNARGHPAHDEPRCVDLTVRMHRLAAPGSGHEGEYRAHSDIGDSRHGPNRARRGLRTGRGHALGRAARRRRTRRSMTRPRAWAAPTAASHRACRSPRRRHVARAEPSGQARGGDQEMKEVVGGIDGNSHSTWSPVTKPQIVTARYSAPNPSAYARAESRRRHRARPSRPERMCTMLCQPFTRRR